MQRVSQVRSEEQRSWKNKRQDNFSGCWKRSYSGGRDSCYAEYQQVEEQRKAKEARVKVMSPSLEAKEQV